MSMRVDDEMMVGEQCPGEQYTAKQLTGPGSSLCNIMNTDLYVKDGHIDDLTGVG